MGDVPAILGDYLEKVMETHCEDVASWRSPENILDGKENAAEQKALTVIGNAFLDFMTQVCQNSVARQIALLVEKDGYLLQPPERRRLKRPLRLQAQRRSLLANLPSVGE
jgi:hypothetical protein